MTHVTLTCPCCEITGRVRKKYAGRHVGCRHCGHAFKMPPWGDPVGRLLRGTAKTKSLTGLKTGQAATLHAMRKLILLCEQGVITRREFERLRRGLGGH